MMPQCRNSRILPTIKFSMKSSLPNPESRNDHFDSFRNSRCHYLRFTNIELISRKILAAEYS